MTIVFVMLMTHSTQSIKWVMCIYCTWCDTCHLLIGGRNLIEPNLFLYIFIFNLTYLFKISYKNFEISYFYANSYLSILYFKKRRRSYLSIQLITFIHTWMMFFPKIAINSRRFFFFFFFLKFKFKFIYLFWQVSLEWHIIVNCHCEQSLATKLVVV